jgi:hypothetical protein
MQVSPGQPARELRAYVVDAPDRQPCAIQVALPTDLPEGSRLFWHVEALGDAVLHDAVWCTRTAPAADLRLAVLMRTFGRAGELRAQLQRYADALRQDPHHAELLRHCEFWVLDASDEPDADWQDAAELGLQLRVLAGPNLGGGGNASHLIAQFLAAQAQTRPEERASEVLIVDDDMSLSMESLARYLASCAWRRGEFITSLPVLMKSRPTTVWEDGGFWGRRGFGPGGSRGVLRDLTPHLLRHGLVLDGYEHLDSFGPLHRCEYATFIFFGLPMSVLQRLGLPAAFFLRGDDIEYSLRAARLGVPLLSNPNLAAWHEPGHGYGQEYMAILHGAITNLAYSDNRSSHFLAFFERRLAEHMAMDDLAGLAVYQQVLDDLLDPASPVLGPDFAGHYRRLLPALGAPMTPLGPNELERLRAEARAGQICLMAYLYPGLAPVQADGARETLLLNEAAQTCRVLPTIEPAERLAATQRFIASLQALDARFDALRQAWTARLTESGDIAFWQDLMARHAAETRWLGQHPMAAAEPAAPAPLQTAPRRVLRRAAMTEEAATPAPPPTDHRPGQAWFSRLVRGLRDPARPKDNRLPSDFNPVVYLTLNADVARTGMDPALHYLRYGRGEGRRYRAS